MCVNTISHICDSIDRKSLSITLMQLVTCHDDGMKNVRRQMETTQSLQKHNSFLFKIIVSTFISAGGVHGCSRGVPLTLFIVSIEFGWLHLKLQ